MSHKRIEDEGADFGYAKTCMMFVSCQREVNYRMLQVLFMAFSRLSGYKKTLPPAFCSDNLLLTTCQAFELHDWNRLILT